MSVSKSLQEEIVLALQAHEYFDGITLLIEDQKDIDAEIEKAVGSIGICVIVVTPGMNTTGSFSNARVPVWDRINVVVQVIETPVINRGSTGTQKPASEVAEKIASVLLATDIDILQSPLTPIEPTIQLQEDQDFVIWNTRWRCTATGDASVEKVATPVITETDGNITITCATAGAQIYYTTNGKIPAPYGESSVLYTGLFAPAAGLKLWARAGAWGMECSNIAKLTGLTAGGGDGIDPSMTVTFDQIRDAINEQGGTLRIGADGSLVIQDLGTGKFHEVGAATQNNETSIVASNPMDDVP